MICTFPDSWILQPAWQHVQSSSTGCCFQVSTYIRGVGFRFLPNLSFSKAVSKPSMQVAGTAMTQSDRTWNPQAVGAAVLIPAHNASSTIGSTLEALQCNPELDLIKAVIVLDDASSDGTADLAKAAWQSSVPMEVWTNSNEGNGRQLTPSLMRLSAQWVFILHADDVVKPNWISLYLNAMKFCPDDVATICSSYDTWDPESNQIDPGEECPGDPNVLVSGTRESIIDTLNRGCWWHISGCAIRTRAFHQVGGFQSDMPYSGDLEWLLRCLASGFSCCTFRAPRCCIDNTPGRYPRILSRQWFGH